MYILHILYILANGSNIGIYCTILYTILERLGLQMQLKAVTEPEWHSVTASS